MSSTASDTSAAGRTSGRRTSSRSGMSPMQKRNLYWGLLFCSPGIIGILWFQAYPILTSLYLSFTSATMMKAPTLNGLSNYESLATDGTWWQSLGNTAYYIVFSIPLGIIVAMILALLLNTKVRGQSIYRVIFYLPAIVPLVASAVVWLYVFNPQYGVINNSLSKVGITGPGWLADPSQPLHIFGWTFGPAWAMFGMIIFTTWGAGNLMIILLAGLQDVPQDLQDQAMVDGASAWSRFRHVTIPFLSPHLLFALVTGLIAGFQFFTPVFVLANGSGGPANSMLVSSMYLFQNAFQYFKVGYASAIAWVLFIIVAAATALIFKFVGRRVYYSGA